MTKPPKYTPPKSLPPRVVTGMDGVKRLIVYSEEGSVIRKEIRASDPNPDRRVPPDPMD